MGAFRKTTTVLLVGGLLNATMPVAAFAQQSGNATPKPVATPQQNSTADPPVSLERIRRQLAATQPRVKTSKDGLRLEYYVDVYGRAPRIELFLPTENITSAPVMYGGMTHQEFLRVVTPEEFKSPPADVGAAISALVKWLSDKQKNGQASKK